MCFAVIPYNSNYYIFDSQSRDKMGQLIENVFSVLPKFVTIECVLNFVTTKYLINNQLKDFDEINLFFNLFMRSAKTSFKKVKTKP